MQASIKDAAKRNDIKSAKVRPPNPRARASGAPRTARARRQRGARAPARPAPQILATELVLSRKTVSRLYENKAQLNSINMQLQENVAIAKVRARAARAHLPPSLPFAPGERAADAGARHAAARRPWATSRRATR